MGFFSYLLLFIALTVAVVLFLAMQKPDIFKVERRAVIKAPPEAIFEHINGMSKWQGWSPWAKKDPNARNTLSGPDSGVGSALAWDGNKQVGRGRMEVSESVPHSRVAMNLEFFAPMKNTCTATFTLTPRDGGTEVHWSMEGPNLFMGRLMGVFMNMDAMVGKDFEAGLESLKEKVGG